MLAPMSILHWTPASRARVTSFREPPPRAPVDLAGAWATLQARRLQTGNLQVDPELSAAHDALQAALGRESLPEELDVDALAVWARLGSVIELAHFGCALYGVERMVDVWIRTRELGVVWQHGGRRLTRVPPTQPAPIVHALRTPLLQAEPEVRARVRAKLEPLTELGDVALHAAVVTLFPEEIAWARALAAAYLAAPAQAQGFVVVAALHRSACPLEEVRAATLAADGGGGDYESLLDVHGEAALPLLMELLDAVKETYQQEAIARALTIARSPEVAAKLAEHVGKKKVRQYVDAYFQRFPELAEAALGPVAARKGRAAAMAAEMLALAKRSAEVSEVSEAPLETLPPILSRPPWRGGARTKRKPVVVRELVLEGPRAWHGARISRSGSALGIPAGWTTMDDAASRAWLERAMSGDRIPSSGDVANRGAFSDAVQLEAWNLGCFAREHSGTARTMLEVHGVAAAEGALAWARHHLPRTYYGFQITPLADLELPELAPEMAVALGRRVTREVAWRWLRRFPAAAIAGLLPVALGETGARRSAAERALRGLVREGHDVRARGAELGKKALTALDELLGWDPLSDCPAKPPKLSARYRPESLVRPTTRDGHPLPLEAVRHLDEMLAFTPMDPPYAGLEVALEVCDPRSLAEHAWSLARTWETSGARKSDDWMMRSLVHLADDEVVRRMTPALKNKLVVEVLVAIGSDAAAMELATIGARGGSGPLRELAETALDQLAEARGLDRDRLDEQLTPTLGLDASGGLTLDYGPRAFHVVFDEHLVPHVRGDDGKVSASLPRTRKGDDAAKVEAARKVWDELREDVAAIGLFRIQALQRAMLSGATWSVEELESAWTKHPLMTHLARRMVFVATRDGEAPRTFRVAEDGTYVGVDHEAITLAPDARVGVPHPLRWPDESTPNADGASGGLDARASLAAWIEMLVDYEIVQPFPQLARPIPAIDEAWLGSARIVVAREESEDFYAQRRRLATCGWSVASHPYRLELEGGLFVLANMQSVSRGGVTTHHAELIARRGTDEVTWGELPRATLLRVLDDFA